MSTFHQFHLFPHLPVELRLKIWPLTFLPRVLEIRTADYPSNIEYISLSPERKVSDIRWVTKTPPPAALSVCRESRDEALKVYTLRIQLLAGGDGEGKGGEVIHINPSVDIVYPNFKWEILLGIFLEDVEAFSPSSSLRPPICNLALTPYMLSNADHYFTHLPLERLICVDEEGLLEPFWAEWDDDCLLVEVAPGREEVLRMNGVGAVRAGIEYLAIRRGGAARAVRMLEELLPGQSLYLPLDFSL